MSTAFQSENTTLEELFDCLILLYKFEPDLLIEKAAVEERLLSKIGKSLIKYFVNISKLKSPADRMSSFCFFLVQMLKFRSDIDESKIISLLERADFNISVMLGKVSRYFLYIGFQNGESNEFCQHHKKTLKNNKKMPIPHAQQLFIILRFTEKLIY